MIREAIASAYEVFADQVEFNGTRMFQQSTTALLMSLSYESSRL